MTRFVYLHFLLGAIAMFTGLGAIMSRGLVDTVSYANIWSTAPILPGPYCGTHSVRTGNMKLYPILSALSLLTSIAGAVTFIDGVSVFNIIKEECPKNFSQDICEDFDISAALNIVLMLLVVVSRNRNRNFTISSELLVRL